MTTQSQVTLITVDLDDTVWPCAPVIRNAEAALFDWLGRQASRLTAAHDMNSMRAHRQVIMEQQPHIAHDLTTLRITSLRSLLQEFGYPLELAEQAMTVFLEARNRVTPFPDVAPALKMLGCKYCVASLTNGNADVQLTPLKDHFHFSLAAAQVGAPKPAPDLFQLALERCGVEPKQAVHVGDDPELDILAARPLGMRTVWVNRTASRWPGHLPPPDVSVTNFYELDRWLAAGCQASNDGDHASASRALRAL
jgi:putative hydrolase of the HAD superfamily